MPVDDHGLNLVNEFITANGIEKMSLAAKYDVAKNVMIDTLSGRLRTPQAHKIILKIIDDFKLRQKGNKKLCYITTLLIMGLRCLTEKLKIVWNLGFRSIYLNGAFAQQKDASFQIRLGKIKIFSILERFFKL